MKRFYQILLLCLIVPPGAFAQQADTASYTLEQCVKYALENTVDVKNARVDAQISEARVKETFGIGLPQVSGEVSLQHNQKLPRFFSTYATAQGFAGQDENGNPLLDIPGLQPNDVVASPNFFQLPSSGNASITINQLLFSSTYLVGLKAAGTYKELAYKTEQQTQIQVVENVTKAYYAVLVNNERINLFDNNIARVDSLLRSTTAMNKNGFAEEIDVDRIKVTLNNLKSERLKFINLQNLSLTLLKFQMNYPMDQPLAVEGTLDNFQVSENIAAEYEQGFDPQNRIEYKVLSTQRELQKLDIKNKYSNSLPSLSGFANLGYTTQSPNVSGLFKTNTEMEETSQIGPDKWYSFSSFGVSLKIPLFSGLQRNYQVQQAKLSLLKIENSFTSLRQSIDLSIQQNTVTYQNSIETLKSQRENMELAEKVARVTKIKYEQGVGSNIEVTDAESSLREAQVNYYNALYDAIIAKVDLDKAYAKIDPSQYTTAQPAK
ncbi:TolC family protein [Ohtaekwangia kribbensis]|jgi:outer membrane protein|uniref:TolC family protein n=1 Tax=Ohtaekwangia kribbensis TaxID=688913 RepID=A0ABW3JXY2_9BACT